MSETLENTIDKSTDITNKPSAENKLNQVRFSTEVAEPLDTYDVLVIDDDKWIQKIMSSYLSQNGFNYIQSDNPYHGLELAITQKPLAIFLDILMPEVNGTILLNMIKRMSITKDIPTIILSGELSRELVKVTYAAGACGFVTKPFNETIVLEKIRSAIDPKVWNRMAKDGKINPKNTGETKT